MPSYLPELDGLRGLAVLGVVFYHCHPRLAGTWFGAAALWGWTGVSLFFVLSGFLITSILLEVREQPHHYFLNFYARRVLRIWPVYLLVIVVSFAGPDWLLLLPRGVSRWQSLMAMLLLVQNLFSRQLTGSGALGPTWSLAIEEQYYLVWAPVVRCVKQTWLLAALLVSVMVASPLLRLHDGARWNATHTLLHLDGIAAGSLLALGLMRLQWQRRTWLWIGVGAALGGLMLAVVLSRTAFLDSAIALCFAGAVLMSIAATGNSLARVLRRGLLPFYGRISYGLYLVHVWLFIYFGFVDIRLDARWGVGNWRANACVVAMRLIVSTVVAAALWYGLERRVLRLKKYFVV